MAEQQSWTSWLFGTNTSVTPVANKDSTSDIDKPTGGLPQNLQGGVSQASTSPYGPFVRTGRGGAGNFTWQSQQSSPDADNDTEAQRPPTLSARQNDAAMAEHLDTRAAVDDQAAQKPSIQYIRVGRGMVPSNEVQSNIQPRTASMQSIMSHKTSNPSVAHPGRGGAGNHAMAAEHNERAKQAKQEKEQNETRLRRGKIEEEIENMLPAPPDAWLGGRQRSADLPEKTS